MSQNRSYQDTIEYLYGLQKHGVKLGLENPRALMQAMGDPHRKFPTVHVAGTNGKGSTSAYLAAMLQAAGYRVGLYTSPHLVSFTERIRINNRQIPEERVVALAGHVRDAYRDLPTPGGPGTMNPTFFEVTTAIAFRYFSEEQVEIAVIETGMGGRLDATNVITPLVSIITNIDIEHTEYLGDTLEKIAAEKAGIIKPGIPVVTAVRQPEVIRVIDQAARENNAAVHRLDADFSVQNISGRAEQIFDYQGMTDSYRHLGIRMLGLYQTENAALSLATVECLRKAGFSFPEPVIRQGLLEARWPGRLEYVARDPDVLLDGAHNPASAKRLAAAVEELRPHYREVVLVIGILGDKDVSGIVRELAPCADRIIVTKPHYSRALDVRMLEQELSGMHRNVASADTVASAIERARSGSAKNDLILVTGSLYVVGEARAALVRDERAGSVLKQLKG
jgi:dihydrofolate synthase / folylpolyglutamate synthase